MFFKSMVLFEASKEKTKSLSEDLKSWPQLKIFSTNLLDELEQIVHMSEQSALIFDDKIWVREALEDEIPRAKHTKIRFYFIDWDSSCDSALVERLKASSVYVIQTDDPQLVKEKLELYFFGKIGVFNRREGTGQGSENILSKALFTHLLQVGPSWEVRLSSHERVPNIDSLLGENWDVLLKDLIGRAGQFQAPEERRLASNFYEIIYPHIKEEQKKLSIIHLKCDQNLDENLLKIRSFLQGIN